MRIVVVWLGLLASIGVIAASFVRQDRIMSATPTVPAIYGPFQVRAPSPLPVLYHFSAASCPCSDFAAPEVDLIEAQTRGRLIVKRILTGPDQPDGNDLARQMGVTCTPTAVLVRKDGSIAYRGRYNRGRFCDNPDTAYASLAVRALLEERTYDPPKSAMRPLGCVIQEGGPR